MGRADFDLSPLHSADFLPGGLAGGMQTTQVCSPLQISSTLGGENESSASGSAIRRSSVVEVSWVYDHRGADVGHRYRGEYWRLQHHGRGGIAPACGA